MLTAADAGQARTVSPRAGRRERAAVAALASFAALRVALYAAAFPFFTNVDEHRHVDLAWKYSHAAPPRSAAAPYEPEMAEWMARIGALDYQLPPGSLRHDEPGWRVSPDELERRVARNRALFERMTNLDAFESPAYYALAGGALAALRALGVGSESALYALRLLNALLAAGLVVCACALLRRTHAGDPLVRWGAPVLIACFPQDAWYYVTPDALSPLLGGVAFAAWVGLRLEPAQRAARYAWAGGAAALAFLTKPTNLFAAALAALAAASRPRALRPLLARHAAYALAFALPVAAWTLRNALLTGDALGSSAKVAALGWQPRPPSQWLAHPLLTPTGFARFALDLVPHFWRGELVWRRYELAWPVADAVYSASTATLLALALATSWRRAPGAARETERAAGAAVALAVATLCLLSLSFVFPERGNPSAARPWFYHGRLIDGALLPFAVVFLAGLRALVAPLPPRARDAAGFALLAALCLLSLGSELWLTQPVFASPHNLLHWH